MRISTSPAERDTHSHRRAKLPETPIKHVNAFINCHGTMVNCPVHILYIKFLDSICIFTTES